ncbi:hypothetical protein GGI20_004923 [Coemansia sp. BCRC 34301]|nr:hypothetical protein GGI20_004923 [Coemansia sp. BCRC 34301]
MAKEHAYRWWDVFASNAASLVKSKVNDANSMLGHAQSDAAKAGKQVTSNAEYLGLCAQKNTQDASHNIWRDAVNAKQQAQDNVEYVGMRAQDGAEKLGQMAKQEAVDAKQQAEEGARHAPKRIKQVSQAAYSKASTEGKRMAQGIEQAAGGDRNQARWLHNVLSRVSCQAEALGSATRGADNQLRSRLKVGLYKLRDLAGTSVESMTSEWPEEPFASGSSEAIARYAQQLSSASQHANAQLKAQVEAQGAVLESIASSYVFMRLPLAGFYGSLVALMLIYLVGEVWRNKDDMSHKMRQRAEAANIGVETMDACEGMVATSIRLAIVPMVVVLLIVMELNGSPGWLVIASYTCLLASMLAAANPALLASIWDADGMGNIEQRLAAGITVIAAVSCLAQTVYG